MSRSYDSRHRRGRHRNAGSPETRRWQKLEASLRQGAWIPPAKPKRAKPKRPPARPPARPPWLSPDEYEQLLELRKTL